MARGKPGSGLLGSGRAPGGRATERATERSTGLSFVPREVLGALLALLTVAGLGVVFVGSNGMSFLTPGALSSSHGAIETCNSCHAQSGTGNLSWINGLAAREPHGDSKACLTCHKMPEAGFNAHGVRADVLKQSTERLTKIADTSLAPLSVRAQNLAFPVHEAGANGLACATCHQEHQGSSFKLAKMSNEQCASCHVVKFDSFDGGHPKFENYPFRSRTRIIYDHAGHFGKHYPDMVKKGSADRIPATCSTCHTGRDDKRVLGVAPFEKTCSACHLDQIKGKERVSGPKGIAFLSVPGLDLQSLNKKKSAIGEWPDASDAKLTPFMKVMLSRKPKGRAAVAAVEGLGLQDLSTANDAQIKAVTVLAWEIKALFHALISRKASDVLGDLNVGGQSLSANLVSDLTASLPRDVVIAAQQQWLPNLAAEIANGPGAKDRPVAAAPSPIAEPAVAAQSDPPKKALTDEAAALATANEVKSVEPEPAGSDAAGTVEAVAIKRDPPACLFRLLGECLMYKEAEVPSAEEAGAPANSTGGGKKSPAFRELPEASRAGLSSIAQVAQVEPERLTVTPVAGKPAAGKPADQSDELLFPTEDELREINARNKAAGRAIRSGILPGSAVQTGTALRTGAGASAGSGVPLAPQSSAATVTSLASTVDAEAWADFGGWYQQDHAIFYRPTGHKDKLVFSWLALTGPHAPAGDASPPAKVFDALASKDAQGSCVKCHSVDEVQGKGRVVNFTPLTAQTKPKGFTRFIHEPHFGVTGFGATSSGAVGDRGCRTCHELDKGRPYLKSYEQNNPHVFASEFGAVEKDTCQTCHNSGKARQDCQTCHKYHVNDVITPITATKLTSQ